MDFGGIILAGGKSVRMGTDKGLLKIGSKTLTEISYETIEPFIKECLIVSNNPDNQVFGCKTVPDLIKNIGPLGGLFTGLTLSNFEYNLVIGCDTPFIGTELFAEIVNQAIGNEVIVAKENNFIHPLSGMYRKTILPKIKVQIEQNTYKMMHLISNTTIKTCFIECNPKTNFANINTKEIFESALLNLDKIWHKH